MSFMKSEKRYAALPRPLLDIDTTDPFHVGDHIKSYVHNSQTQPAGNLQMLTDNRSQLNPYSNGNSRVTTDQLSHLFGGVQVTTPTHSDDGSFTTWDTATEGPAATQPTRAVYDQVAPSDLYRSISKPPNSAAANNTSTSAVTDTTPPPLPPRDYKEPTPTEQTQQDRQKKLIRPMMQEGQVLSHTHYFLLAPKPSPPLASVKPFDPRADHAEIHTQGKSTFFVGHENKLEPDYVNRDEIVRVGPTTSRHANQKTRSPLTTGLHIVTKPTPTSTNNEKSSPSLSPRAQVQQVNSQVPGTNADEAYAALQSHQWDIHRAVQYLKVEQLFRLRLTSRERCKEELLSVNWNTELAASNLIDKCHIGVDV